MKMGKWAWLLLAAAPFVAGCADFWNDSSSINFTLSNSGNILISSGTAGTGTSTITVTPSASTTGTVALTCAVTTSLSSATSPATCSLSSSSISISGTTAETSTLTATTTSTTTPGIYEFTVTGVSGSNKETTSVCVDVTTSSTTACTTSASSGNFYILSNLTSTTYQVAGYSIATGSRSSINTADTVTGQAYSMAIAPNGDFLCVSSSNGVYAYPVASGKLGTPVKVTSDTPYAIQVAVAANDSSTWLIEALQGSGGVTMSAIPIVSTTGANNGTAHSTDPISVSNAAVQQNQLVISPDNTKVFVALGAGGTLVVDFDATGFFSSGSAHYNIPTTQTNGIKGSALSVAVDPNSHLFYIGETLGDSTGASGGLLACDYASANSDTCSNVSGSPAESGGVSPLFILPDASGKYVYVANGTSGNAGNIAGFAVTSSSISASPISTVATAVDPQGLAEDSTDSYILEVGENSPYFAGYTFDSVTVGKLDSSVTSGTPVGAIAIVAAPK
jgi:hypothetical protein